MDGVPPPTHPTTQTTRRRTPGSEAELTESPHPPRRRVERTGAPNPRWPKVRVETPRPGPCGESDDESGCCRDGRKTVSPGEDGSPRAETLPQTGGRDGCGGPVGSKVPPTTTGEKGHRSRPRGPGGPRPVGRHRSECGADGRASEESRKPGAAPDSTREREDAVTVTNTRHGQRELPRVGTSWYLQGRERVVHGRPSKVHHVKVPVRTSPRRPPSGTPPLHNGLSTLVRTGDSAPEVESSESRPGGGGRGRTPDPGAGSGGPGPTPGRPDHTCRRRDTETPRPAPDSDPKPTSRETRPLLLLPRGRSHV